MRKFLFLLIIFLLPLSAQTFREVSFYAGDGLEISADLYAQKNTKAPFLLLFHRARWSRGEYRETAPMFMSMGYNCLAIDQRSGDSVNGIKNKTTQRAKKRGKKTQYIDAYPDMVAALKWVKEHYKPEKLIVVGSSYSSSLVFRLAAENKDQVNGVIAFSPGEYYSPDTYIQQFAAQLSCPVFVTSAASEKDLCTDIFNAIPHDKKRYFLPGQGGYHGSEALWKVHPIHVQYWKELNQFLQKYF